MQNSIKKIASLIFLALGAWLFVTLIVKSNPRELLDLTLNLGWHAIIAATGFIGLTYIVQTIGWQWVVRGQNVASISFGNLLGIKLVAEALNTVMPAGSLGGDPYRIIEASKIIPGSAATASVIVDRTLQTLTNVVMLILTVTVAWFDPSFPDAWKVPLWLTTFVSAFIILVMIRFQRRGGVKALASLAHALHIQRKRLKDLQHKIVELDHRIASAYHHDKRKFITAVTWHTFGKFMGIAEIWLIGIFLGIDLSWPQSAYLFTLSVALNTVFAFVPGTIGVMEGGFRALAHTFGLPLPAGLAIQLVRRTRMLIWAFVGLAIMGFRRLNKKLNRSITKTKITH